MTEHLFREGLLILFIFKVCFKLTLNILNFVHLKQHAGQVPEEIQNLIEPKDLLKIDSYNATKMIFRTANLIFDSVFLILFLFTPIYSYYTNLVNSLPIPYLLKGISFFMIIQLISWLINLPFDYYFHFQLESRFGFNKYSVANWFLDGFKGLMVNSLLTIIVLTFIFSVWGDHFRFNWTDVIIGWSISFLFILLLMYLVPILLIPFFYKLKPIDNPGLQRKIEEMVVNAGFKIRGIYQADESSKSTHANAQFAGFGNSKTIIIFDTLINFYSEAEILAVLAHEIGHGKERHLLKLMGLVIIEIFAFIIFGSLLLSNNFFYNAIGIPKVFYSGAFFVYIIFFDLLTFFLQPFFTLLSRKMEYEADAYSRKTMGSGQALITTFRKFITSELENINPHPYYESFYYSHPSLLKRIKALK